MFLFIIVFVKVFSDIFGEKNTLVGVSILIALLVLLQEDLTIKPIYNFFSILILSEVLAIFSYLANENIYLGFCLTFLSLFIIGYLLSYNLNKILIVPFGLQYLFMLYTPVQGYLFTKRLIGLAVGCIIIMISQFILNRKRSKVNKRPKLLQDIKQAKDEYKNINIFGKTFNIHYIRGTYAIRIGLVTAISSFIVNYFSLEQGRWIVYTVFSLTELYSEHCIERSKQRFQGTIIGTILILILFIFIKDNALRGLLVLGAGYMDSFTKNYRQKMICVTVSVIASVSITNGTLITAIERIVFVTIGIIIALVIDRIVFHNKENQKSIL